MTRDTPTTVALAACTRRIRVLQFRRALEVFLPREAPKPPARGFRHSQTTAHASKSARSAPGPGGSGVRPSLASRVCERGALQLPVGRPRHTPGCRTSEDLPAGSFHQGRLMSAIHHTREYQACVRELKARGRFQPCMTAGSVPNCHLELDATVRRGRRGHMTLGHIIDHDAGGAAYDPRNYGAQCEPCNAAGGARRTNAKRRGITGRELTTSPDWT